MLSLDLSWRRHRPLIITTMVAATFMLIVACGGGESDPTAVPEATPVPTAVSDPVATSAPAPTQAPEVQPTAAPTSVPDVAPTSTPVPTATATPLPTPSPTPVVSNTFEGYGFSIQMDQDSSFASSDLVLAGWTGDVPDDDQGLMTFTYNGAEIVLFWEPQADSTFSSAISSTFQLVELGRPGFEFTAISQGDLTVDGQAGRFGGFVFADAAGENASGGLIGTWACPQTGNMISLTAISGDATALQIRFDRLISGFECGS